MTKALTISGMLAQYKDQIEAALPKHVTPERLTRLAMTTINRTPKLKRADPISLFGALIQASQLGLEPGITAHLVPFDNRKRGITEVQFIADYRGLMMLARQSGEIATIEAEVVRHADEFWIRKGTSKELQHVPAIRNRGDIIGAYAIAYFRDSTVRPQFDWMDIDEIEAIKRRSKASQSGPWVTDFAEMAKKTVVRRLCKYLPTSVQNMNLQHAITMDERAERGANQNNAVVLDSDWQVEEDEQPKPSAMDRLAQPKAEHQEPSEQDQDANSELT